MQTVVTTITMAPESEDEWDQLIRARFHSVHDQPGWVSGQLLTPEGQPHARVIVGTWQTKADWEAWHQSSEFLATRAQLDDLVIADQATTWFDVVEMGHI